MHLGGVEKEAALWLLRVVGLQDVQAILERKGIQSSRRVLGILLEGQILEVRMHCCKPLILGLLAQQITEKMELGKDFTWTRGFPVFIRIVYDIQLKHQNKNN